MIAESPDELAAPNTYSAWLRATKASLATPSNTEMLREMRRHLREILKEAPAEADGVRARWFPSGSMRELQGALFSGWANRGSLPATEWEQQALIAVVEATHPQPPAGHETDRSFKDIINVLNRRRERAIDSHGHDDEEIDRLGNILVVPPARAIEVDELMLGLGSWLYDGALPPYVPRAADRDLLDTLNDPNRKLTVLLGDPKAGKTRSLLATLRRSALADRDVWWVRSGSGVLPEVVAHVKRVVQPVVVVLDDLQLHGVDATRGITDQRISDLSEHAHVIATLHTADLARWRYLSEDHSTVAGGDSADRGVSPSLVDLLARSAIEYATTLVDDERSAAEAVVRKAPHFSVDLHWERLPETLAAVSQLLQKARSASGYEAALVDAGLDAYVIYPSGATLDQIERLSRIHLSQRAPNRPWRPAQHDDAVDWATAGINTGSPHAILQSLPNDDRYRLLDALHPYLQSQPWNADHLVPDEFAPDIATGIGLHLLFPSQGLDTWASIPWLERGASAGTEHAAEFLATALRHRSLARRLADPIGARADLEAAGALGDGFALSLLADETDDLSERIELLERAVRLGDAASVQKLARIAASNGDIAMAKRWRAMAVDSGDWRSANWLGLCALDEGDHVAATEWFELAAAMHDNALATGRLGEIAELRGDLVVAKRHYERAAVQDTWAAMRLAKLAERLGDDPSAIHWYEESARRGNLDAVKALSRLADASLWEWVRSRARAGLGGFHISQVPTRPGIVVWFRADEPIFFGIAADNGGMRSEMATHLEAGAAPGRSALRDKVSEIAASDSEELTESVSRWIGSCQFVWIAFPSVKEATDFHEALSAEWLPSFNR